MPKRTVAQLEAELAQARVWPVYWVVGQESMRVRETCKRIELACRTYWGQELQVEKWDATDSQTSGVMILESAQSLSLLGKAKLILVKDAQSLKDAEVLRELWQALPRAGLQAPVLAADCPVVVVGVARDLDQRKKWSKELTENVPLVDCPEVKENEREDWVKLLIRKRKLTALLESDRGSDWVARLASFDPWSLDLVDQELAKWEISGVDAWMEQMESAQQASQGFLEFFFKKQRKQALESLAAFVHQQDQVFPLIGLMAWNLRQLMLWSATGTQPPLNPWVAEKLRNWRGQWSLADLQRALAHLLEVDVALKQKPLETLGVWSGFVQKTLR